VAVLQFTRSSSPWVQGPTVRICSSCWHCKTAALTGIWTLEELNLASQADDRRSPCRCNRDMVLPPLSDDAAAIRQPCGSATADSISGLLRIVDRRPSALSNISFRVGGCCRVFVATARASRTQPHAPLATRKPKVDNALALATSVARRRRESLYCGSS
jgi:hypothetical protein